MLRIVLTLLLLSGGSLWAAEKPNILWFVIDDMSPNFSCYGEKRIRTPNVDRLAREGTRFTNAFITAPVCSPCRSALITGMYQTSIGSHHHRSGRGKLKIDLPADVTALPVLLKKAGYFTCIGPGLPTAKDSFGKTDYNFVWDPKMYDSHDWADCGKDQPFFMQVQLPGGKMREGANRKAFLDRVAKAFGSNTKPEEVTLPPYYPRDPVLLADWAAYLDACRMTDEHVGKVLARLEKEKRLENTLIVFITDHGISHARGKQFLYNEGTHIPLIVRGPGVGKGVVREDLVMQIDLAAISLAAAKEKVPAWMQGKNVLAKDWKPREEIFAARDRCDETVERLRSVRTEQYLYIRNFYPKRPHLQPNAYKDGKPIIQRLRQLHADKKLPELSENLLFAPVRPEEELYDWKADPHQIKNLADDPKHRETLMKLRGRLDTWMKETKDGGPESDAMYDSDMAVYLDEMKMFKAKQEKIEQLQGNIDLMKRWQKEGK
jgi:arylsulfatase A-like enzyme